MAETPTQSLIKRLDVKLDTLSSSVATKEDLRGVSDRLDAMERTLFKGNGKPALMERVTLVEVGQKNVIDKLEELRVSIIEEERGGHHFVTFKGIGEKLILPVAVAILMLLLTHVIGGG